MRRSADSLPDPVFPRSPSPFCVVPETILKKRKRDEQWAAKATAAKAEAKKKAAAKKQEIFKRAEKYVQEYRQQVGIPENHPTRCFVA